MKAEFYLLQSAQNNFIERTSSRLRAASKMAGGQEMYLCYR